MLTAIVGNVRILRLTRAYEWLLRAGFALAPLAAVVYVAGVTDPGLRFVDYVFHEVAIGVMVALSGFVAYVTWRCYRHSGEPFLLWVALGLTGFTVVYLPHGALTHTADCNIRLFLLYGPVSRVVMVFCLFVGLLHYGDPVHDQARRLRLAPLWWGLGLFSLIDVAVAALALSPVSAAPWVRIALEAGAIAMTLASLAEMLWRRIDTPLMWMYALAMCAFAESCLAFVYAQPWNHLWWLAHLIFAGGFFMLSFGVIQAFHTTRAFATVYSQEELMRRLERANRELEHLAAFDALTGAATRRHFLDRVAEELARAARNGSSVSLLMLDLDHFKSVNDGYGHPAGDAVLVAFVERMREIVRGADLIGRLGGEEFVVLLPDSVGRRAAQVGERIRAVMDAVPVLVEGGVLRITVSIGVAQFGVDGDTVEAVIKVADERLYRAKHEGRNRVVA